MALGSIGERGRACAEQRLQLVRSECFQRWHAGDEQGRNRDQSAAARNGIDEARHEGGDEQKGEEVEGDVEHGRAFAG